MKPAYDVVVIGGGNAGAVRRADGARARRQRAGARERRRATTAAATAATPAICAACTTQPTPYLTDAYAEDEFFADLLRVTGERPTSRWRGWRSASRPRAATGWACTASAFSRRCAARCTWAAPTRSSSAAARRCSTPTTPRARAARHRRGLRRRGRRPRARDGSLCRSVEVRADGHAESVARRRVVVASGGFEANLEWLRENWGDAADNFVDSGHALQHGARCCGCCSTPARSRSATPRECHAVAVDARAPKFDGGIVTRLDCIPVRHRRQRARRSASTTRARTSGPSATPSGAGWSPASRTRSRSSIIDAKVAGAFMPSVYPPIVAGSIDELAAQLQLPPDALQERWPRSTTRCGPAPSTTARWTTAAPSGLTPEKTHWAQRIDTPPYLGLSAAAGDHLHLPWRARGRAARGSDRAWSAGAQRLRRRRSDGRQHPAPRLPGGVRDDDRHRVRPDCRAGSGGACSRLTPLPGRGRC